MLPTVPRDELLENIRMSQAVVVLIVFPPIGACVWWLLSRAWARTVEGGIVSERTVKRQRAEFWVVLVAAYAVMAITELVQHKL